MTDKQLLEQALEALEKVAKEMLAVRDELAERGCRPMTNVFHQRLWDSSFDAYANHAIPAAEAIRARLEQPEQEPVAWLCHPFGDAEVEYGPYQQCENCMPLYTTPPAAQPAPAQRWAVFCGGCRKEWSVSYPHPGESICNECEAKLKEKNG